MSEQKFEVTKEFILEAHGQACSEWRQRLEDTFPKAFETKANQWLYTKDNKGEYLFFYDGTHNTRTEGFYRGEYQGKGNNWHTGKDFARECTPAKKADIERMFTAEIRKRGYDGQHIDVLNEGKVSSKPINLDQKLEFNYHLTGLEILARSNFGRYTLYGFGEWMDIIPTLTKSEVEEKYKIKIRS